MKNLSIERMIQTNGGEPTCGNSFFMAFTGLGVIVGAFEGDVTGYHMKFMECVGIID
ncbi:hypothetical protein [Marivirga sp.]|uniref:hypothetical protein n=1 Tax=Marivirga sp. TaxID=2018662 RepID=UPI003DA7597A